MPPDRLEPREEGPSADRRADEGAVRRSAEHEALAAAALAQTMLEENAAQDGRERRRPPASATLRLRERPLLHVQSPFPVATLTSAACRSARWQHRYDPRTARISPPRGISPSTAPSFRSRRTAASAATHDARGTGRRRPIARGGRRRSAPPGSRPRRCRAPVLLEDEHGLPARRSAIAAEGPPMPAPVTRHLSRSGGQRGAFVGHAVCVRPLTAAAVSGAWRRAIQRGRLGENPKHRD